MKHVKWIFVVLLLCSLTSFVGREDVVTQGLRVGNAAPDFAILNTDGQSISLKEMQGSYVLICFWATYDAPSREQNVMLSNALKKNGLEVKMVSVSFDDYASVFNWTIKQDEITTPHCFVETSGEASGIYKRYRLKKGFQNYLLDERGVIIAKNITADQFSSIPIRR